MGNLFTVVVCFLFSDNLSFCRDPPHLQVAKLVAPDGATFAEFGDSVAMSDDSNTIVVGAYGDDIFKGAAYVFQKQNDGTTYAQETKLVADDAEDNDGFGLSVATSGLNGDTIVVGAIGDDNFKGAAYVFQKQNGDGTTTGTTYVQETKLVADDAEDNDWFGYSVATSGLNGDTIVVGAAGADRFTGAAYVFHKPDNGDYEQEAKLVADDSASGAEFGYSVAVSDDGNTIVVGAAVGDDIFKGAAYVFQKQNDGTTTGTTYSQETKLVADDAADFDRFGWSVAVSDDGNSIVVGALFADNQKGAAYVFQKNGGTYSQETKLVANDAAEGDELGSSVAMSGDGTTVVVGANDVNGGSGSSYVFQKNRGTYSQETKLVANDAAEGDLFGRSVAMSGDGASIVVGAPGDDGGEDSNFGSAYVFLQ